MREGDLLLLDDAFVTFSAQPSAWIGVDGEHLRLSIMIETVLLEEMVAQPLPVFIDLLAPGTYVRSLSP